MRYPLLVMIVGICVGTSGWAQDEPAPRTKRSSSVYILPTDNNPQLNATAGESSSPVAEMPPWGSTNRVDNPYPVTNAGMIEAPQAMRARMAAGGDTSSHLPPGAQSRRATLHLTPPPASYGEAEPTAEASPERIAPHEAADAAPEEMYSPPQPPATTLLPVPGRQEDPAETDVQSAYYEQAPGNSAQATEVQKVSGTSPPLASLPAMSAEPEALPLAPPSKRDSALKPAAANNNSRTIITVIASLGAVIGLFLVVAWGTRKALPKGLGRLPNEVVETLGRLPLNAKTELHLIRLGNKLVLVSSSGTGMEPVAEVTDPLEVERIMAHCRGNKTGGPTAAFRETLAQVSSEPARGFAGEFARAYPGSGRRS